MRSDDAFAIPTLYGGSAGKRPGNYACAAMTARLDSKSTARLESKSLAAARDRLNAAGLRAGSCYPARVRRGESPRFQHGILNRIPQARRDDLIEFALEHEALTTRELAVKYTDEKRYFISESSAYRFLKEADLITAPEYVVIKAADEFTGQNHRHQPDVADRFHLLQDHRLGLVLSQHDPGRLQPLYHRLETLHQHAGRGRD